MTRKDVDKVITYIELFNEIPTFNKSKRKILELALNHVKSGAWEIVTSRPKYFIESTVGGYHIERITNKPRGKTFEKTDKPKLKRKKGGFESYK